MTRRTECPPTMSVPASLSGFSAYHPRCPSRTILSCPPHGVVGRAPRLERFQSPIVRFTCRHSDSRGFQTTTSSKPPNRLAALFLTVYGNVAHASILPNAGCSLRRLFLVAQVSVPCPLFRILDVIEPHQCLAGRLPVGAPPVDTNLAFAHEHQPIRALGLVQPVQLVVTHSALILPCRLRVSARPIHEWNASRTAAAEYRPGTHEQ